MNCLTTGTKGLLARLQLAFILTVLLGANAFAATQLAWLVDCLENMASSGEPARISLYLDPLKINWIAWSTLPDTPAIDGEIVIGCDRPYGLINGCLRVTIVDPHGNRSEPLIFDGNDAEGNPTGQQAVLFGSDKLTPPVLRTNAGGARFNLVERGLIDEFVKQGGEGYYTIEIEALGSDGTPVGGGELYILMNAYEGWLREPPVRTMPPGELLLYGSGRLDWGSMRDWFDDDDDDGGRRSFPPPPLVPENPGGEFPPPPNPNEPEGPPIIPEPATVMLIALGLAGTALRTRRG